MKHINLNRKTRNIFLFDKWLVISLVLLIIMGLIMVTSASMAISERQYHQPFHYLFHQGFYLMIGLIMTSFLVRVPMQFWHKIGGVLLLTGLFLLVVVLVPGIGHSVNGSLRWIGIGGFGIQVSEFMKLAIVIYLSSYLVRHEQELRTQVSGFLRPMVLLGMVSLLLLMEPDFGATVVIIMTALSMMFLAGVRAWQFVALLILVLIAFVVLAISSPYRMARLTTFLNPWAHQFNTGYQLTQSLIAFGRGGIFGVGLGASIQKLFYLPEAHTDFLFAVLAEELGLIGVFFVIGLYVILVVRALFIGRRAQSGGQQSSAYMAYGFAVWIGMQALVNIGVNSGLLPTKGLTLPLMSYGGSSMLIMFAAIAILLRIDYESHFESVGNQKIQAQTKRARYGF